MSVRVYIVDGPVPRDAAVDTAASAGAGAAVMFEGFVRPLEDGRPILALDYQVYEPMASREITRIAEDVKERRGLIAVEIWHSRGRIAVGECSFRLVIWSAHRKEALAAADEFIDRLKREAPIWKSPQWAGATNAAAESRDPAR